MKFVKGTLSTDGDTSFYAPIKKYDLKTFTDMQKKTSIKRGKQTIKVSISPEVVFKRALAIAYIREDVTLDSLMCYPIGPVPVSLFHPDGAKRGPRRTTTKSDLMKE